MQKTELLTPFGARATIYHQGAHVTSWVPSESLGEQLFLAQQSEFAAGKAIRGGVPVCFPQFAAFGNGIKHGFARNVEWQLVSVTADQTEVVFVLADSPQTRELWPHAFNLLLRVTVEPMKLIIRLEVVNCGDELFEFSGALHSYFAVSDYRRVVLSNLSKTLFWDNGTDLSVRKVAQEQALQLCGALDRVYFDAPNTLSLQDGVLTKRIIKEGFTDVVVWNPGSEGAKGLKDMGDEEFAQMLCVEAAVVDTPIVLLPGAHWYGTQALEILV